LKGKTLYQAKFVHIQKIIKIPKRYLDYFFIYIFFVQVIMALLFIIILEIDMATTSFEMQKKLSELELTILHMKEAQLRSTKETSEKQHSEMERVFQTGCNYLAVLTKFDTSHLSKKPMDTQVNACIGRGLLVFSLLESKVIAPENWKKSSEAQTVSAILGIST
jgi:hypothetical protein